MNVQQLCSALAKYPDDLTVAVGPSMQDLFHIKEVGPMATAVVRADPTDGSIGLRPEDGKVVAVVLYTGDRLTSSLERRGDQ